MLSASACLHCTARASSGVKKGAGVFADPWESCGPPRRGEGLYWSPNVAGHKEPEDKRLQMPPGSSGAIGKRVLTRTPPC